MGGKSSSLDRNDPSTYVYHKVKKCGWGEYLKTFGLFVVTAIGGGGIEYYFHISAKEVKQMAVQNISQIPQDVYLEPLKESSKFKELWNLLKSISTAFIDHGEKLIKTLSKELAEQIATKSLPPFQIAAAATIGLFAGAVISQIMDSFDNNITPILSKIMT